MMKDDKDEKTLNAKLFVRILPTTDFSYDSIKIENNKKVLYVRCLQDLNKSAKLKKPNYWYFCTDGVFLNSCQADIYDTVAAGLFDNLFDGVRAMILCYGQTGAGKTFTTSGLRFNFENRGLALRILSDIFEEEEKRRNVMKIRLGMSFVEFIGETVKDLITNKPIQSVRNVVEYPVLNEAWAWKQIFNAECRKSFSEDAPYRGSNRGHSVLTFYTHAESLIDSDPVITHSKIHLVDMGGFDNFGNKPSAWKNKFDLGNSNLSKSLMEQLILCLNGSTWKSENHICPYKSSKFLLYLHDSIQPKSLIRIIAHIYGNESNLSLTISTLKFGERMRAFEPTKLEKIFESNCTLAIKNLEKEYLRLKDEVELSNMLSDSPDFINISEERFREIQRAAEGFLSGEIENLTLFSLGQATLTLEAFRNMYQKLLAEKDQVEKDAVATATEMLQAQLAVERTSSSTLPSVSTTQKVSRRKSRQVESQLSFNASFRSSDSGPISVGKSPSVVQQAGITDRKGIGIGPGKTVSNFEGNVAKAFKKLRSRKSESVIIKGMRPNITKDLGIPSSKNQFLDDISELPEVGGIPSREVAWQIFVNEKTEVVNELRTNVETLEETAVASKRKYMATLAELAKLREEIEECKSELGNCQHVHQLYGKRDYDEEGNLVQSELERNYMETVAQKEEQVNRAIENCHVALIDFRNVVDELNDAKKVLEEAFQDFSKEHYKTIFMVDESTTEIKSDESGKETPTESELRNQERIELYTYLQQKLLNYPRLKPLARNELRNQNLFIPPQKV